jgi:TPR repeat protein
MRGRGVVASAKNAGYWFGKAAQDPALVPAHICYAFLRIPNIAPGPPREAIVARLVLDADPPISNGSAQFCLGCFYHKIGQAADARKYLEVGARSGVPAAEARLASMILKGEGGPPDFDEAVRAYKRAADRSVAQAAASLGVLYAGIVKGVEYPPDFGNIAKAKKFWLRAAELGHRNSMVWLAGQLVREAREDTDDRKPDTKRKFAEAAKWYKRAGDLGSVVAVHNYGRMRALGQGGPRDMKVAMKCLIRAAEAGASEAFRTIAMLLEDGTCGLKPNPDLVARFRARADELDRVKNS